MMFIGKGFQQIFYSDEETGEKWRRTVGILYLPISALGVIRTTNPIEKPFSTGELINLTREAL
ncbi:MAG: hypothetical protein ACTS8H_01285 [Arsenophonus sp. NC-PE1-MAG3]